MTCKQASNQPSKQPTKQATNQASAEELDYRGAAAPKNKLKSYFLVKSFY